MFNNRFILVLGVLSLLLVTLAVSKPFSKASLERINEATDFHQRHPEWIWISTDQNALVPATRASDFPDYYQRHPELRVSVERRLASIKNITGKRIIEKFFESAFITNRDQTLETVLCRQCINSDYEARACFRIACEVICF